MKKQKKIKSLARFLSELELIDPKLISPKYNILCEIYEDHKVKLDNKVKFTIFFNSCESDEFIGKLNEVFDSGIYTANIYSSGNLSVDIENQIIEYFNFPPLIFWKLVLYYRAENKKKLMGGNENVKFF